MTIQLTTEELASYQKKMEEWGRAMFTRELIAQAGTCIQDQFRSVNPYGALQAKVDEHLKKNPMPKLIPSELTGA